MEGPMKDLGRWLLIAGGLFIVIGALFYFGSKILPIGRLPGDIRMEGKNYAFYFPLVTSIVLSILLTIILNLILSKR
jgi:hypothetical protein